MKRIPLFLVLTLALAWGYTSWYWYTCNIKGVCSNSEFTITDQQEVFSEEASSFSDLDENNISEQVSGDIINSREQESSSGSRDDIQKLSAEDVLIGNSRFPQARIEVETAQDPELDSPVTDSEVDSGSGTVTPGEESQDIGVSVETIESGDLCSSPLLGPISLGSNNNSREVEKLEKFLIANGYLGNSNAIYGNDDVEAVKRLQLDYKEQMLDPWGIETPTGFVGRTTVATINSIGCKN